MKTFFATTANRNAGLLKAAKQKVREEVNAYRASVGVPTKVQTTVHVLKGHGHVVTAFVRPA